VDRYENLFLIGRNGMHRYNNQDHSMLTAMMAVDDIIAGKTDKTGLWEVNTETDYHEKKAKTRVTSQKVELSGHEWTQVHTDKP
jgi:poly(3-hydroxybutyrate) depolymerase